MNKKEIVKYIVENYNPKSAADITEALKALLGETLQEMMNAEFEEHMGYEKYSQKEDKNNYRNGVSKKIVKTSQARNVIKLRKCYKLRRLRIYNHREIYE